MCLLQGQLKISSSGSLEGPHANFGTLDRPCFVFSFKETLRILYYNYLFVPGIPDMLFECSYGAFPNYP